MIYLRRTTAQSIDIEAIESDRITDRVQVFLDRGYKIVTYDQYRIAWRVKDSMAQLDVMSKPLPVDKVREVGGPEVPAGFKRFFNKDG